MGNAHRPAFLHALSPLHCGTGQGVGSIDLPIARERATNLPLVPGSTIKGCLRDSLRDADADKRKFVFGSERGEQTELAGALRVSDAQLLLLPVRSLGGTFVWVTCPFVLHRFARDMTAAGEAPVKAMSIPSLKDDEARTATADPFVKIGDKNRLVLEELDFAAEAKEAEEWCGWIAERLFREKKDEAWRGEMKKRFAIIDDNSFDHLASFATEVNAHIAINQEKGTVESGALWYQESLPAESVLWLVLHGEARGTPTINAKGVVEFIPERDDLQFGGKATTGMGIARLVPFGSAQ